jgi:prolyl 4-hydroxylase
MGKWGYHTWRGSLHRALTHNPVLRTFEKNVNSGRTSSNAWCQFSCYNDTVAQNVVAKITELTNVPEVNSEYLQLLKYEPGQFYQTVRLSIPCEDQDIWLPTHLLFSTMTTLNTKWIDSKAFVSWPYFYISMTYKKAVELISRSLTLLVRPDWYLCRCIWRLMQLTVYKVEPKRGRALVWPSVLDSDPNRKDPGTYHQALKVIEGVKYGANAWIHMRGEQLTLWIYSFGQKSSNSPASRQLFRF